MKILNINLHFYPESIGGASVVAEKFAWGLVQRDIEVTNVFLSKRPGRELFTTQETPFGRSIAIRNIAHSPANRFYSPAAAGTLIEIVDAIQPDRIFVHAAQHMGMQEFLIPRDIREKTCIVAHDAFWTCLQGFRILPGGSPCDLKPTAMNCQQCAWFPGLTAQTYANSREFLTSCRAVVFPSNYLKASYELLFSGAVPSNFIVQSNPDIAENILDESTPLPPPAGAAAKASGQTVLAYLGGPGETKGWNLVRNFMRHARQTAHLPNGIHVVLFDVGRSTNAPWYPGRSQKGVTVSDAFHWSYAKHALGAVDGILGHVDKWRSQRRIDVMSMKPRKLSAVLS